MSPKKWRWMILISKSINSFITLGMFKGMGVFIPYFVDHFQTSVASVGLALGLFGSLCSLIAPVASAMTCYGPRKLVMIGGAVTAIGIIGAATSSSILHLAMWLSLSSIGESLVLLPSFKPLMDYFPESFATVNGLSLAVGTFGMMLFPPFSEWLIEKCGWRGALCVLGAVNFNLCATGALFRPLADKQRTAVSQMGYQQVRDQELTNECAENNHSSGLVGGCWQHFRTIFSVLKAKFDTTLFVDEPWFTLFLVGFFFSGAVYAGWHLFLVPHAITLGYGSQLSSFLSTFGGIGSFVGRLSNGFLIDNNLIRPVNLFIVASFICGMTCLADPLAVSSFVALSVLAAITGLVVGFIYPLTFVIVNTIAEGREMAAIGWLYVFLGAGHMFGGYFTGWMKDLTQDYGVVFMSYGMMSLVVVVLMMGPKLNRLCCHSDS
ncbi:monocarboxylate transporter 13-like [Asterias amurensis]|uniref:monocarboxylate transporter 13-like n=1 Tax=Asterias amurensis TaxID=7602 RepID=UPI003AB191FF